MKITLVRHFRVLYRWRLFCTAPEFDRFCGEYDAAEVEPLFLERLRGSRVVSSPLPRAVATARAIDPVFDVDDRLVEVPLRSFSDSRLRLPTMLWGMLARAQWYLDSPRQSEGKTETIGRARSFLRDAIERGDDLVVVSHGWFLKVCMSELLRLGFKGPVPLLPRNGEAYSFSR